MAQVPGWVQNGLGQHDSIAHPIPGGTNSLYGERVGERAGEDCRRVPDECGRVERGVGVQERVQDGRGGGRR